MSDEAGEMKLRWLVAPALLCLALVAFYESGLASDLWNRLFYPSVVAPSVDPMDLEAISRAGFMAQQPYQGYYGAWLQSIATLLAGTAAIFGGYFAFRGAIRQGEHNLAAAKVAAQAAREVVDAQIEAEAQRIAAAALARRDQFLRTLSIDLWRIAEELEKTASGFGTLGAQTREDQARLLRGIWFEIPETLQARWDDIVDVDPDVISGARALAAAMAVTHRVLTVLEADLQATTGKIRLADPFRSLTQNYTALADTARRLRNSLRERYGVEFPRADPGQQMCP